jgi:hypothetical protein
MEPDPVVNPPQPVIRNAAVTAAALFLLSQAAQITTYFGWWEPDVELLILLANLAGTVAAAVIVAQGWLAHNDVVPVAKADALVARALAEMPPADQYPIKTREATLAHLADPMQTFDETRDQIDRDGTETLKETT